MTVELLFWKYEAYLEGAYNISTVHKCNVLKHEDITNTMLRMNDEAVFIVCIISDVTPITGLNVQSCECLRL